MENIRNRCRIVGNGQPILLVHGMGGPAVWNPLVDILSDEYTLIIPTLPGFMAEDGLVEYSDALYVEFLEKLRLDLELTSLTLAGLSMGGRTVINYCVHYPDCVSKLIVMDAAGIGNLNPLFALPVVRSIFSLLLKQYLSKPERIRLIAHAEFVRNDSDIYKFLVKELATLLQREAFRENFVNILTRIGRKNKSWHTTLPTLTAPTLILWGGSDQTTPVQWARQLNQLLSHSTLEILDGFKHMAVAEQPEFFAAKMRAFFAATSN